MVVFRRVAVLMISAGLTACQSTGGAGPQATANSGLAPPPSNYRQLIAQQIKSSRVYATRGIVEAEISNPGVGWGGLINGGDVITVCVRYKVPGGLIVSSTPVAEAFFFPNGKMESGRVDAPGWYMLACGRDRTFRPFPEIERKV